MALRKVKKTFQIDSADRDTTKYPTNGDYVVYLPRIYNNVTSLRLKGGEFANLNSTTSEISIGGALVWLDASNSNSITINGNYVSGVNDLVGTSNFTVNPNTVTYSNNTLKLPSSPSSGNTTLYSSYPALGFASGSAYSLFIVFDPGPINTLGLNYYILDVNSVSNKLQIRINNNHILVIKSDTGIIITSTATISSNTTYLIGLINNGSSLNLYINGLPDNSYTTNFTGSGGNLVIGTNQVGENQINYVKELILYNSAISGTSLTSIQNYLLSKWGLLLDSNEFKYARKHYYTSGSTLTNDAPLDFNTYYFLMELEGLNKCDETRVGGDKSAFVDKYFAKIPAKINTNGIIAYTDKNLQENIAYYTPANENLDRLHIKTRTHAQQDGSGFIYFPTDYNLTFEIEYMDNSLEDDVKDDKN
jgi:hypothetical protein